MKKCAVIGSVPPKDGQAYWDLEREGGYYVICADGGLKTALRYGVTPNLFIGDFDSFEGEVPPDLETIRLNVEKDDTDLMAAVREGMKRGYREFLLLGVLGGERCDHSFASLCTLQYLAHQGCKATIEGDGSRIFLLNGGRLLLNGMKGRTVSVFPFGCSACEVSYEGLKYPLTKAILSSDFPLGVSNRVEEEEAQIIVHNGDALIFVLPERPVSV
mgnify:CR=1 FL=1